MIKNEMFVGNITTYISYLQQGRNFQEPVATMPEIELVTLLACHYGKNGDFIYGIEVKR